jgi:hypothetical protein
MKTAASKYECKCVNRAITEHIDFAASQLGTLGQRKCIRSPLIAAFAADLRAAGGALSAARERISINYARAECNSQQQHTQIQIQIQINFIQLCLMIQEHFTTLRTCQK